MRFLHTLVVVDTHPAVRITSSVPPLRFRASLRKCVRRSGTPARPFWSPRRRQTTGPTTSVTLVRCASRVTEYGRVGVWELNDLTPLHPNLQTPLLLAIGSRASSSRRRPLRGASLGADLPAGLQRTVTGTFFVHRIPVGLRRRGAGRCPPADEGTGSMRTSLPQPIDPSCDAPGPHSFS